VRRLANQTDDEINDRISQMCFTIRLGNEVEHRSSYLDCFRGVNRRRTEICCVAFAGQMLSGAQFAYGPTYFLSKPACHQISVRFWLRRNLSSMGWNRPIMDPPLVLWETHQLSLRNFHYYGNPHTHRGGRCVESPTN
jgi:hypothetical protein